MRRQRAAVRARRLCTTDFSGLTANFWLSWEFISRVHARNVKGLLSVFATASREGLTPSPTCLPGQGGSRKGMRPVGNEAGRTRRQPLLRKSMEGGLFSRSKPYASAYLATDYVVRIDGRDVVIRPNERSAAVDRALSRFKARSAAFITAFNPYSRRCGKHVNLAAHAQLLAAVRRRRRRFVEGLGQSHDQRWPAEKSVLVFGVTRTAAAMLGRQFRQNAIVFAALGRRAELVYLS